MISHPICSWQMIKIPPYTWACLNLLMQDLTSTVTLGSTKLCSVEAVTFWPYESCRYNQSYKSKSQHFDWNSDAWTTILLWLKFSAKFGILCARQSGIVIVCVPPGNTHLLTLGQNCTFCGMNAVYTNFIYIFIQTSHDGFVLAVFPKDLSYHHARFTPLHPVMLVQKCCTHNLSSLSITARAMDESMKL